jgi:hypothetical protein
MGLFKQIKDLTDTVHQLPDVISHTAALGSQAQQMAAAQAAAQTAMGQQAFAGTTHPAVPSGPRLEPIAGVSLELYAAISRECGRSGVGLDGAALIAAAHGVAADAWQTAMEGWNARMADVSVAQSFRQFYEGA